jgi:hypothetical protein
MGAALFLCCAGEGDGQTVGEGVVGGGPGGLQAWQDLTVLAWC